MNQQPPSTEAQSSDDGGLKVWARELVEAILPALVIVLVVNIFLAQATRVEGQSMEPNLHNNERLIIEKLTKRFHSPVRGDIIVIRRPQGRSDPLIKRVIGLPGDTVEVRDGHVYINGEQLDEPYIAQPTLGVMSPRLVPEEHVFVLGDNRNASNDSRAFGVVPFDDIIGRAWFKYWPMSEIGPVTH